MAYIPTLNDTPEIGPAPQASSGYVPTLEDTPQVQQPQQSAGVNPATAAIAGLSNAGASALETAVDAGAYINDAGNWLANKLGIMSDQSYQNQLNRNEQVKQGANQFFNYARSGLPNQSNDVFNQSYNQYPGIAKTAQYGADAAMLMRIPVPALAAGGGVAGAIANTGARAVFNGVLNAGAAGGDKQNQNFAFGVGSLLSPAADAVTAAISKGAKALNLPTKIGNLLQPIYDKIAGDGNLTLEDKAVQMEAAYTKTALDQSAAKYKAVTSLPGTIDTTVPVLDKLDSVKGLSEEQSTIIQNIQQDLAGAKNMEDAVRLRQYIAANQSAFRGAGVRDGIKDMYSTLLSTIDNKIGAVAEQNGVKGAYDEANNFYRNVVTNLNKSGSINRLNAVNRKAEIDAFNLKQGPNGVQAPTPPEYVKATKQIFSSNMSPQQVKSVIERMGNNPEAKEVMQNKFLQDVFKDTLANPQDLDKNAALVKINQMIGKYKDVLGSDGIKTLEGAKDLLREAGAVAKKSGTNDQVYRVVGNLLSGGAFGGVGGYEGYQKGGVPGAIVGAGAGIAAGLFGKGLIDTSTGQAILRSIAGNPAKVRQVLQLISVPNAPLNALKGSDNAN